MEPINQTFNYMTATDLDALIQAAEARGEKRGYEKGKLETEAPMSVKEAAKFFGVSESGIRNWITDGTLPHHKVGGRTYLLKTELMKTLTEKRR